MLVLECIPSAATFKKEENGVKWYSEYKDRHNVMHYMTFDGRMMAAGWCGPHAVLWALASMTQEERASYDNYDVLIGAINTRLSQKFVSES